MKKCCLIILCAFLISTCLSACSNKTQNKSMIKSKRRFAEYVEPQTKKQENTIDLSEGPKLRYDADFGPKNLNFDIKIVNPY